MGTATIDNKRRCNPKGTIVERDEFVLPNEWTGQNPRCVLAGKRNVHLTFKTIV